MSELEEELAQANRLDVGGVKDICRYFLSEYVKVADKWVQRQREKGGVAVIPDSLLVEVPLLPVEWRVRIWKYLLACHNKDESLIRNHIAANPLPPLPASYLPSPSDRSNSTDTNGTDDDTGIELLASPRADAARRAATRPSTWSRPSSYTATCAARAWVRRV